MDTGNRPKSPKFFNQQMPLIGAWSVWPAVRDLSATPVELYVYECRGPRFPEQEPRFEGYLGLWPEPPFFYLFADRPVVSAVSAWVLAQPGWELLDTYQLDYEQWQQGGMESCRVGSFSIRKVDGAEPEPGTEGIIRLRPGLVFGTGLHPTTQACLQLIDEFRADFGDTKVIDLGTGTGVLAIACARVGASLVVAADCNPMAVRETRVNIRLNDVQRVVQPVVALGLETFDGGADWLLMNVEYPVLLQILPGEAWRAYPSVLLSGFMPSQWETLKRFIPPSFRSVRWLERLGWCAVVLRSSTEHLR